MFWYPQAPTYGVSGLVQVLFVKTCLFLEMRSTFFDIECFHPFWKTPNRRRMQFHAEKLSNFVLSSHKDPIGDQNDV